jgi:hypothetical protein
MSGTFNFIAKKAWDWFSRKKYLDIRGSIKHYHIYNDFEDHIEDINSNRFIGSLKDYVYVLELMREEAIDICSNWDEPAPLKIHVCTMQGLSDWPLWDTSDVDQLRGGGPLQIYTSKFNDFIERNRESSYKPSVKRAIVVDNYGSSTSHNRLRDLKEDVNDDAFHRYIESIHTSEEDARIMLSEYPWPIWMSDIVFYGIEHPKTGEQNWLWAAATSYQGNRDDVISIRLLDLNEKTNSSLPFPNNFNSLNNLANHIGMSTHTKQLTKDFINELIPESN